MGAQAFRDGIFSQASPLSPYGMLLQTYSDGSLGAKLSRDTATAIRQSQPASSTTSESASSANDVYPQEQKTPWLWIGGGMAAVAVVAFFVLRK